MSNLATDTDWEDDDLDDTSDSFDTVTIADPKLSRKDRLDIRRKLEDRMELKRLRQETDYFDESEMD